MKSAEEALENYFPGFRIEIFPFAESGYIANFVNGNGVILGTGSRLSQEEAINVSISEGLERELFQRLSTSSKYLFDKFPSTCGMAVGLNSEKTVIRSKLEAFERWAFSNWVDHKCKMTEVNPEWISPLTKELENKFTKVRRFEHIFSNQFTELPFDVRFGVTIGYSDKGVFLGSRVASLEDDAWEHSALESWICLTKIKNNNLQPTNPINSRILFFANNSKIADIIIEETLKTSNIWPVPEFYNTLQIIECPQPFNCYRSLYLNYIPWTDGNEARMVY